MLDTADINWIDLPYSVENHCQSSKTAQASRAKADPLAMRPTIMAYQISTASDTSTDPGAEGEE